ncbi:MAG TPA: hypothetical protein VH593_14000 [Ktedonobacteraceae bacterium]|jgi:hypothetical protein
MVKKVIVIQNSLAAFGVCLLVLTVCCATYITRHVADTNIDEVAIELSASSSFKYGKPDEIARRRVGALPPSFSLFSCRRRPPLHET